jgi:anti-sigma factor RsiW
MTHDEISELLAAHALDAVDGDERTELEAHLAECPRCRAALDSLREVAAALGNSVEPLPEGLWSHIASQLPERQPEEEPPAMPALGAQAPAASPFRSPPGARRRKGGTLATVAAIAVAAAAVAVVLGIGLVRADNRASNLQAQVAQQSSTVTQALATPGRSLVDLYSAAGTNTRVAQFVVVPDGRGYLVSSSLPSLSSGQTYQLWGFVGSDAISLGLLGPSPRQATFTMAGTTRPSRLSITAEPAGGTVVPTSPVVASGTV